jgi:hypothetical protein
VVEVSMNIAAKQRTWLFVDGKREMRAKESMVEVTMQDHSTTVKTQDFVQEKKRKERRGTRTGVSSSQRVFCLQVFWRLGIPLTVCGPSRCLWVLYLTWTIWPPPERMLSHLWGIPSSWFRSQESLLQLAKEFLGFVEETVSRIFL